MIRDFHDLVRILEEHPEWRAELRRLILTDELLKLPELFRELAGEVKALAEAQRKAEERLARLERRLERIEIDVGELKGDNLERRYREHAGAYFSRLVRRAHALSEEELDELLEDAIERNLISYPEKERILPADLVVRGRDIEKGEEVYLVVEVSWRVGVEDVERSWERAELFGKTGLKAVPVAAGKEFVPEARKLASKLDVKLLSDGRLVEEEG